MYIQNECTFKINVHSKWIYIWHNNDHVCHILCVIATLWIDCHILIIIATLWACLPYFEYYCHTVAMLATFCLWLPLCGHVCHILSTIATLWQCLLHFDDDCHSVSMFATFWVLLPHCCNVFYFLIMIATLSACVHLPQMYICHKSTFGQMYICPKCTFIFNVHSFWM